MKKKDAEKLEHRILFLEATIKSTITQLNHAGLGIVESDQHPIEQNIVMAFMKYKCEIEEKAEKLIKAYDNLLNMIDNDLAVIKKLDTRVFNFTESDVKLLKQLQFLELGIK
jgi:hypothetical protein